MGKLDELRRAAGTNVDDSMGVGRSARPVAPTASTPARWQGVSKAKNAAEIPLGRIERDSSQPREHFDAEGLARLAESLKVRGQLQPVRVRWDEGRGVYVLITGERRWRAAETAGLATLTCIVHEGPVDPDELLLDQLTENALREDVSPVEQARAFRAIMDRRGWSARQVARELNYPQSTMVKVLGLLDLPEAVREQVDRGELPVTTAYELSKLGDASAVAEVAGRVVAEKLTRSEAVAAVRRRSASKGRGAKPRKVTTRTIRTAVGRVTIENRRGLDAGLMEAALTEALARIRAEAAGDQAA